MQVATDVSAEDPACSFVTKFNIEAVRSSEISVRTNKSTGSGVA
jgi:hypothetical protein